MATNEPMAVRIKHLRTRAGMSQKAFAKKLGISINSLQAYESGGSIPGGRVLQRMCDVLEINGHWLLTGAGGPEVPRSFTKSDLAEFIPKDIRLLASRGRQEGPWHVLFALTTFFPDYCTLETIAAKLESQGRARTLEQIEADLAMLQSMQLIDEKASTYRARSRTSTIRAVEMPDITENVMQGILSLMKEILPGFDQNSNKVRMFNILCDIPSGESKELISRINNAAVEIIQEYAEKGGQEEVSLFFSASYQEKNNIDTAKLDS